MSEQPKDYAEYLHALIGIIKDYGDYRRMLLETYAKAKGKGRLEIQITDRAPSSDPGIPPRVFQFHYPAPKGKFADKAWTAQEGTVRYVDNYGPSVKVELAGDEKLAGNIRYMLDKTAEAAGLLNQALGDFLNVIHQAPTDQDTGALIRLYNSIPPFPYAMNSPVESPSRQFLESAISIDKQLVDNAVETIQKIGLDFNKWKQQANVVIPADRAADVENQVVKPIADFYGGVIEADYPNNFGKNAITDKRGESFDLSPTDYAKTPHGQQELRKHRQQCAGSRLAKVVKQGKFDGLQGQYRQVLYGATRFITGLAAPMGAGWRDYAKELNAGITAWADEGRAMIYPAQRPYEPVMPVDDETMRAWERRMDSLIEQARTLGIEAVRWKTEHPLTDQQQTVMASDGEGKGDGVPDGYYSSTDIAKAMRVPDKAGAIGKALKRAFDDLRLPLSARIPNENQARGQAKFLYRLSKVRPFLARFERHG